MMKDNNNIYEDLKGLMVVAIAAIIAFLVGIAVNVATVQPDVEVDTTYIFQTDTVWQDREFYDTITIDNVIDHYITKVDTVYTKDGSEIALQWSKKTYADTLTSQGDTVSYKAYLSGIEPTLDSIQFKTNHRIVTNTNNTTITAYEKPKKRFKDYISISPNISFGYGLVTKKIDTYAGVGIAIHL